MYRKICCYMVSLVLMVLSFGLLAETKSTSDTNSILKEMQEQGKGEIISKSNNNGQRNS